MSNIAEENTQEPEPEPEPEQKTKWGEDVIPNDNEDENKQKEKYEVIEYSHFEQMGISEEILRKLYAYGIETPSWPQKVGIVPMITGHDLLCQSVAGSGKSLVYLIGLIQQLKQDKTGTRGVIFANTRELANQILTVAKCIAPDWVNFSLQIGGTNHMRDFSRTKKVEEQKHVVIGTPGRILDFLNKKRLDFSQLDTLVIDEADEILSRGFIDQMYNIFQYVPTKTQITMFSATLPPEMREVVKNIMNMDNYVEILLKNEELTLEGIQQYYVVLDKERYKFDALCDLYDSISITQCIIYCNTKKKVLYLTDKLKENDFVVSCMLGDMIQSERNDVMTNFRKGDIRILITTDILARGIDVQQVSLVLNYDLPYEKETYIHRIGRSGRFGRKGVAINFVMEHDAQKLKDLEKFYNTHIKELPADIESLL